ncbi:MAG: hypothetical protein H6765_10090 [Candidatus Peribacteria bacterium]|nr:MAG: hypothetical protein H6765_10090 [Candidatus Peribacteria bacterium]
MQSADLPQDLEIVGDFVVRDTNDVGVVFDTPIEITIPVSLLDGTSVEILASTYTDTQW